MNLLLDIDLITLVSLLSPLPSCIVEVFRVFPSIGGGAAGSVK